jgi:uncharacterized protein (DUF697 family)
VDEVPELDAVEAVPESLWKRIRERPDRTPEHVAIAAAEHFAAPAASWAAMMRAHHDPADAAGIARRKHVWLSRLEGAALGIGGAVTAVPDAVALAWIQGRMVFFVAAAYGFDPHHPMRPAELLALQGLYPTAADARAALDGIGRHMALRYIDSKAEEHRTPGRLAMMAGRYLAKRASLRLVPVLASPLNAVANARLTAALGDRALRYYGGDQARP